MDSMTDILSDKEPEKQEVVEAPAEAPPIEAEKSEVELPQSRRKAHLAKEYEAQGRDPATGQFIPKDAPKEEVKAEVKAEPKVEAKPEVKAPQQEMTEKERGFLRGLEEERRKRQELERQIAEIKKAQPQPEKKTFWDDPEGHLAEHDKKQDARERGIILNVSERLARSRYADFDQNIAAFSELLNSPSGAAVQAQFISSQDPAELAYKIGKHHRELKEVGSIDDLRAKIEKETRAKLEAEYKTKQEEFEKARAALPSSLSDVKGATKQHTPVFKGPTPFEDILKLK